MLTLHVDAERLVRSRFALSRLTEVTNALEVLAHPERAPYARSWVTQTRRTLDPGSVDVLFALVNGATAYIPDFLSPLPGSYQPTLDENSRPWRRPPPRTSTDSYGRRSGSARPHQLCWNTA